MMTLCFLCTRSEILTPCFNRKQKNDDSSGWEHGPHFGQMPTVPDNISSPLRIERFVDVGQVSSSCKVWVTQLVIILKQELQKNSGRKARVILLTVICKARELVNYMGDAHGVCNGCRIFDSFAV